MDIVEFGFVGGIGYRLIERQNALIAGRRSRADPAAARLFRTDYDGPTLRDHFGLAKPPSRFAKCAPATASA